MPSGVLEVEQDMNGTVGEVMMQAGSLMLAICIFAFLIALAISAGWRVGKGE